MKKLSLLILHIMLLLSACGGGSDADKPDFYQSNGVAIEGYDPVAYFTASKAVKGEAANSSTYQNITYHFSSEENKALFEANPESYIPAYGGYCAYAMADASFKMEPDPENWQIQDGRLLLFYEDFWTNLQGGLQAEWNTAPEDFGQKADAHWSEMTGK